MFYPAIPGNKAQETETPPTPTVEVTEVWAVVDDPSGVETVGQVETITEELTREFSYTLRDVVVTVLLAAGAIFTILSGLLTTVAYVALRFLHGSVAPDAVKDIFLLGVQKGIEGLQDVSKRVPTPFEIDDKVVNSIAEGVKRYFDEIGYTPPVPPPHPEAPPRGG